MKRVSIVGRFPLIRASTSTIKYTAQSINVVELNAGVDTSNEEDLLSSTSLHPSGFLPPTRCRTFAATRTVHQSHLRQQRLHDRRPRCRQTLHGPKQCTGTRYDLLQVPHHPTGTTCSHGHCHHPTPQTSPLQMAPTQRHTSEIVRCLIFAIQSETDVAHQDAILSTKQPSPSAGYPSASPPRHDRH